MAKTVAKIDGVVIGIFLGFDDDVVPLVVFPGNPEQTALPARSLTELTSAMIGSEIALMFQGGDTRMPLIVGRIVDPVRRSSNQVVRDGENVRINAEERLELRCGKATIVLEKDGHITIRGTYLVSHASASNRIRGGSINLN
ncbi:DUF6484 domain-containing protein [Mesorhizobium sp. ORM8.1]